MEVLGYAEAARWVYEQAVGPADREHDGLMSVTEVRRVHTLAMGKVWEVAPHPDGYTDEAPGSFRQHDIHPFPGGMTPPTHPLVSAGVASWVKQVNRFGRAVADGTLGVNEVPETLARLGWPPAVIFKGQRKRYLKALDRADHDDLGPLAELIARSVVDNLHRLIPDIAGPAKYVPLEALVDEEFSLAALKQAAVRGRLEAIIGTDGRYRSSRAAVEAYKASKYSRGGKG
jgi:hypothetical protein